jgi:hypothetical protein
MKDMHEKRMLDLRDVRWKTCTKKERKKERKKEWKHKMKDMWVHTKEIKNGNTK